MKLRDWFSRMQPSGKGHGKQKIMDAIHILDGKVDPKDVEASLDYLHHNEPEIALDIVIDRLAMNQIPVGKQEFEKLRSAWVLVSADESRLDVVRVIEGD